MAKQKYTDIGGQAVIEGVMMRSKQRMAISVRDESGKIQLASEENKTRKSKLVKLPIVRGCVNFFDMLVLGVKIINQSLVMYCPEDEEEEVGNWPVYLGVGGGLLLSVGLFILLPTWLAGLFGAYVHHQLALNLIEGGIRVLIFIGYLASMSLVKDMKRLFMYHGAEHKTIACFEHGEELTVKNVRKYSRLHPRCGTTFLFLVMLISILVYSCLIWTGDLWLRIGLRLLFLPLVAGISYEVLKGLAHTENKCLTLFKSPGLMLQKLTTKEPEDDMLEVAIVSFQASILSPEEMDVWLKQQQIAFAYFEEAA